MAEKPLKLTIDESDRLYNMLSDGNYKLLERILAHLLASRERAVLKCTLDNGEKDLIYKKLRAEGAERIVNDFMRYVQRFRKEKLDER